MLYLSTLGWEGGTGTATTLRFGALQAPRIGESLRGRLPFGRTLGLQSEDAMIEFRPAGDYSVERAAEGVLVIGVPPAALDDLIGAIGSEAGRAPVPSLPGLEIEIVPTRMRDAYGNETGEVIG